ncbi:GNAT family N-acetyltransferase [Micromonospora sp. NPDC007208]|uniref:GNAT family N-acetyltransferase n=1 Tax=Micromonospora sp. NPDC007208 TaxID=3364236 RepID=UPI0036BB87D1
MPSDQTTPDFSIKPTLTGEWVILRPFVDDDLDTFRAAVADPEVARLTGSPADDAPDEERLRSWYGSRNAQTDRLDLAVVDRATGACVGEVVLNVRVYEKVGFVVEGVLRQVLRDGDDWVDATVMSILAPECAAHRGHPERRGS